MHTGTVVIRGWGSITADTTTTGGDWPISSNDTVVHLYIVEPPAPEPFDWTQFRFQPDRHWWPRVLGRIIPGFPRGKTVRAARRRTAERVKPISRRAYRRQLARAAEAQAR